MATSAEGLAQAGLDDLERDLQTRISSLKSDCVALRTDPNQAGSLIAVVELSPELLAIYAAPSTAGGQGDPYELHLLVSRVRDRVRQLVVDRGHGCSDVLVLKPGTFPARGAPLPSDRDRLTDNFGLRPGESYKLSSGVRVESKTPRSPIDIRAGGAELKVTDFDALIFRQMIMAREELAAGQTDFLAAVQGVLDALNADSSRWSIPGPIELISLLTRTVEQRLQVFSLYQRLVEANVLLADPRASSAAATGALQPITFLQRPGSVDRYLIFTGRNVIDVLQIPPMDFLVQSGLIDHNVVMLRDKLGEGYTKGISTDVDSLDDLLSYLRGIIVAQPQITTTNAMGISIGAFGAVLCGYLLQLREVWCFGLAKLKHGDYDLRQLLGRPNGVTTFNLHYNQSSENDRVAAEALAPLHGVRLFPEDGQGHVVMRTLWEKKKLAEVMRARRPAAAPSPVRAAGMPTTDDVKSFIRLYLQDKLARAGHAAPADDLSLTESGVIDSFGLLDLVAAVEKKFSLEVDMDDVDLDTFTTFGGFAQAVVSSST